tara:strand:- start:86 stop:316 length:231 start_codon:yes stop_codon:yes gene_type:complete
MQEFGSDLLLISFRLGLCLEGSYNDGFLAGWQSGYAEDCKSLDAGSIPTPASSITKLSALITFFYYNHAPLDFLNV